MKPKVKNTSCGDIFSNQCGVWEAGEVPCLGICNGDQLSIAEKAIADKVCELAGDLDFKDLDLSCLVEKADKADKSIQTIIKLLYDNQCSLKELFDNFQGDTSIIELNVNLKCLKKFDEFDNEIPQDYNQAFQSVVNQICINTTDINVLKGRIDILQEQVDEIPTTPPTLEEPRIVTCLTPGLRTVSQTVPLIATEICDLQNVLGTVEQISQALSQQCDDLNVEYQSTSGWQTAAANIAHAVGNIWIVVCNLRDRIDLIEQNCCAVTCEDIKLGFEVLPNDQSTGLFIKFTSKSGTLIPSGFVDCGSIIIFSDKVGNSIQYPLVISNGVTQGDFDITGLDLSDFINIEVTAKLCADGISCEKCVSRLYKMNNALCPFCEITVTGDPGSEIVIVYED